MTFNYENIDFKWLEYDYSQYPNAVLGKGDQTKVYAMKLCINSEIESKEIPVAVKVYSWDKL